MINKACFILIVAMSPASLFAGVTMVTQTTLPSTKCNFRVDKCETSVATDTSYVRFKDGTAIPGSTDVGPANGDPTVDRSDFGYADYSAVHQPTIEELVALIRSKLGNCPEVTVAYDDDSGDITVHYLHATCDCDCDWVVNVRNVNTDDFVWKRTSDNYSERLGQMERRKFHCASEKDAQDIQSACMRICAINSWAMFK
jgi:hypothetical protein